MITKDELKQWIKARNSQELVMLFVGGLIVTYLFWLLFIHSTLTAALAQVEQKITLAQADIKNTKEQVQRILTVVNGEEFATKIKHQQSLTHQSENFEVQLKKLLPTIMPADDLPRFTKDILMQQVPGIKLTSLKDLPDESWIPPGLTNAESLQAAKSIDKFPLQLEFSGNYFNTMRYLDMLDKLKWHIYWESLDYKVMNYPSAEVVLKFYVLGKNDKAKT